MNDPHDALYSRLAKAAEYGRPMGEDEVLSALNSEDQHNLWLAVKVCGVLRIQASVERLFSLAQTEIAGNAPDIPMIAAWSLARIASPQVRETVQRFAKSTSVGERRVAADLLGLMRDADGLECLNSLLTDQDQRVALWAALSLSKYGSAAIKPLEITAAQTQDPYRVGLLLDALDKIGSDVAASAIDRIISQRDEQTRATLQKLLTEIRVHNEFIKRERRQDF